MAQNFNITAKIQLQSPSNIRAVVRSIQTQLNSLKASVNVNIASGTTNRINALNANLQRIVASLNSIRRASDAANIALLEISNTLRTVRGLASNINVNINTRQATQQITNFGGQAALAVRRFAAFAVPTTLFLGLVSAIKEGVSAAIEFDKEMIRLSQVTGKSVVALSGLSNEITRLATSLGASSKDLSIVATTIAQAGLSAKDTKIALEALAKSSLAATFTDIKDTTEGAIAVFQQFDVQARDLEGVIGSLNAVSAQFAVESDDLVSVIRRTGGAFKASGGNLNELLGLFTSVRSTTRESADSIATGFRTIFTRIQRPRTIQFLKELGVSLQDAKGQFIGPLESIRRLNAALSEIPTTDPRFASVIEELGGFRQVSKVIPLIQQFPDAIKAISVAEQGQQSIVEDSITAQKSLANQIAKVKEEFLALFREITGDKSLQAFAKEILNLARGLIEVTRAIKPLLPLIGVFAFTKGVQGAAGLGGSFLSNLTGKKFASGGKVPGSGNSDSVPAMLTPGEFVIKKSAAKAIGFDKLARMNKFKSGGVIKGPVSGPIDEEFGIAGLYPAGKRETEDFKYGFYPKGSNRQSVKNIRLRINSLTSPTSEKLQKVFKNKIYSGVSQSADILQKTIGVERSQPSNLFPILKKRGFEAVVGNLFESSLAIADAPFKEDKESNLVSLDFPSGLGNRSGLFGLPPGLKADAKARADSGEFKRSGRNLDNYLSNKYAVGEKIRKDKNGKKSLQRFKQNSDRAIVAAALNSLTDDEKKEVKGIIDNPKNKQWSSVQLKLDRFGLRYLKKEDGRGDNEKGIAPIQFATGGQAPGYGNEDKVPALLTPGEFVINKKAARKIGLSNLNRLNNSDKVQKFKKGGNVGLFSRAEGAGFAIAGLASLSQSFIKLDGSIQKAINSISAIAVTASGVSIALRSMTNQRQLNLLKGSGLFGGPKGSPALKFLAKNFDAVSIAASVTAGALAVFGTGLQESAAKLAKTATTQEELNTAISRDRTGSTLSGAALGAGSGAALGTFITPGLGTAIGAGVGGVLGGAFGAFNSNTKELIKAFNQAKFDRIDETLSEAFDDFTSGRETLGVSALNISKLGAQQLANVKGEADPETRQELTKQLKNNLSNYRALSSAIIQNVNSFDEFKAAYGGAGKELLESIAFLTNKSLSDVAKQAQNEIEANQIKKLAASRKSEADSQIKIFTVSIKTFSDALLNVSDKINETQGSLEQLISTIEGGTSSGIKFNSIPNDLFARAASGGVTDTSKVVGAAKQLTGLLDINSKNAISESVASVANLKAALPGILEGVAQGVGLSGDTERADTLFDDAVKNLAGVSDQMKTITKSIFLSELTSRESSGDSGIKKVIREDILGLIDKLVPEAVETAVQELDKVNSTVQNIISTIGDRLAKQSQVELSLAKQRAEIEDRIFEVAKLRLRAGEELTLDAVKQNSSRRRGIILGGAPELGAFGAGNRILKLVKDRQEAQNKINAANPGSVKQQTEINNIKNFDSEIGRLTAYMKELSNSTAELTLLQDKLSKAEADRQSGKTLLEKLLYGEGKDRVKFAGAVQNIGEINKGNKRLLDLPKQQRDDVLELIREAPQNRPSGLFNGKKPEEFLNEQIRKDFNIKGVREVANVAGADELSKQLTTRTKEEEAIRTELIKVQQASVDAEIALYNINVILANNINDLNNKLISDFPKLFKNALADASLVTLGTQAQVVTQQKNDTEAKIKNVQSLADILGVKPQDVKAAGTLVVANQGLFQSVRDSREKAARFAAPNDTKQINAAVAGLDFTKDLNNRNLVGNKLTPEAANNLASRAVENQGFDLNNRDFITRLQTRLSQVKFGGTEDIANNKVNVFSKDKNGNSDISDAKINQLRGQGLQKIINDEITKFKQESGKNAKIQEKTDLSKLEQKLRPIFGNSTNDVIKKLIDINSFNDFNESFNDISISFVKLETQFKDLEAQLGYLNAKIKEVNGQKVVITPNPTINEAVQRARGGIIGGRQINSQITAFTPKGTDKIPAILSKGEFVVNAAAAKENIGVLNAMNFARGGRARITKEQYQAQKQAKRNAYLASIESKKASAPTFIKNIRDKKAKANQNAINRNVRSNPKNLRNLGETLNKGLSLIGYGNLFAGNTPQPPSRTVELERGDDAARQALQAMGVKVVNRPLKGEEARQYFNSERDRARRRVRGFASGGPVPGSGNRDSVPALLTPGEFALNRRATKSLGLHSLANFNQKFANGGVVTGSGGGAGGMLNIDPAALASLEKFYSTFTDVVNQFGSSISRFSEVGMSLSSALTNWGSSANRLAESLASFPTEVQVTHSAIPVIVSVSGLEGLETSIADKVLTAVSDRMAVGKAKANDGKSPFFSNR